MSQRRTAELLAEAGRAKVKDIVELAIRKGDAQEAAQCQGYIDRDLRNLRRYGEAIQHPDKTWELLKPQPSTGQAGSSG